MRRVYHSGANVALAATALVVMATLVLLPLGVVFTEALRSGLRTMLDAFTEPEALAAARLTLTVAAITVPINTVGGLAAAWCIVRFEFPGRGLLVTLIELPLAVSPVISGLVWLMLFGAQGWFGHALQSHDVQIVFALPGLVLATLFVTFPLVGRQLMPLMREQGHAEEEAAMTLGAGFWHILWRVTLPNIRFALLQGVLLCNARAMGEFGAVSVVSGRIRGETNTLPLYIQALYDDYQASAAFAMAALLAGLALLTLGAKTALSIAMRRGDDAIETSGSMG